MRNTYDKETQRLEKMWNDEHSKMEKKLAEERDRVQRREAATIDELKGKVAHYERQAIRMEIAEEAMKKEIGKPRKRRG